MTVDEDAIRGRVLSTQLLIDTYEASERGARNSSVAGLSVAVGGAFGVVASAVVGAAHVPQMTKASWTAYIIAASGFGALVVVGLAWFLASHSNSKDLGRVRRQVRAIDVYAADLPHDVAVLLKAVVAPRVLTEHGADEPWSSPAWLSPDDVLCALGKPKREPRPKAAQGPAVAGPTP